MYEVEVRPGPGSEFFQYYTETVEALTSHDAELKVKRSNPGCIVRTTRSWDDYDDDVNSSDSNVSMNGGFILALLLIAFLVYAWKWILLIGGIAALIWGIIQFTRE
jgi:hypothetical protein